MKVDDDDAIKTHDGAIMMTGIAAVRQLRGDREVAREVTGYPPTTLLYKGKQFTNSSRGGTHEVPRVGLVRCTEVSVGDCQRDHFRQTTFHKTILTKHISTSYMQIQFKLLLFCTDRWRFILL